MSTAIADRLTRRWVRAYTRPLPLPARDARRAEVESDLWEHHNDTLERGLTRPLVTLEIISRLVAGVPADLAWRHAHLRSTRGATRAARHERNLMTATTTTTRFGYPTWLAMLAALTGALAVLMGLSGVISEIVDREGDSGAWGAFMVIAGAGLLLGLWLVRRAPLASVVLLVICGLGVGVLTFWMVVSGLVGLVIAVGAVLSAPRVLGAQPSA